MRNAGEQEIQQLLNQFGGEPLEGSGFEDEVPDPSFERTDPNPSTDKRRPSLRKKERRDVK